MMNSGITIRQNAFIITLALHLFLIAFFLFLKVDFSPSETEYIEIDLAAGKKVPGVHKSGRTAVKSIKSSSLSGDNSSMSVKDVKVKLPRRRKLLAEEETVDLRSDKISLSEDAASGTDTLRNTAEDEFLTGEMTNSINNNTPETVSPDNQGTGGLPGVSGEGNFAGGNGLYRISWDSGEKREVIYRQIPEFPEKLDRSVELELKFSVSPAGEVLQIIPLKKVDPELERITVDAFYKWRFSPAAEEKRQWGKITFNFIIH